MFIGGGDKSAYPKTEFRSSSASRNMIHHRIEDAISVNSGNTESLAVALHLER